MTSGWRRLRPSPRGIIGILLVIVLVGVAWWQSGEQNEIPYDPADTGNTGLRALVLWLEALGHPVEATAHLRTLPPPDGLVILHPSPNPLSDAAAQRLRAWVAQGGTLVLVGPGVREDALVDFFDVEQVSGQTFALSARQGQPLLPETPAEWTGFFSTLTLAANDAHLLPVLVNQRNQSITAVQPLAGGRVWHLTEDVALTNLHLRDERIATLIPAILRTVAPGAPVLVLGNRGMLEPELPLTVQRWLYRSPLGWGVLTGIGIVLLFIILQGRRLGPPLPDDKATTSRPAADYVHAMAALQRRAHQRQALIDHHRARLKSALAQATGADPDLADPAWADVLQHSDRLTPDLVQQARDLLQGYGNSPDDRDLIQLVRDTDRLIAALPRTHAGQTVHRRG